MLLEHELVVASRLALRITAIVLPVLLQETLRLGGLLLLPTPMATHSISLVLSYALGLVLAHELHANADVRSCLSAYRWSSLALHTTNQPDVE